jgi:hypothetical protein
VGRVKVAKEKAGKVKRSSMRTRKFCLYRITQISLIVRLEINYYNKSLLIMTALHQLLFRAKIRKMKFSENLTLPHTAHSRCHNFKLETDYERLPT